jgi:hypothetical protein
MGENLGVEVLIKFPQLDGEFTFLNTDYAAGVSSFSVENGNKFTAADYFVMGSVQSQKTEILKADTPSATSITTTTNSLYAHSRGEKIQFIPYNQVVIERSTDSGSTYAVLTTLSIRADSLETYYNDVDGLSTYLYRVRFKNETTDKYSSYSDAVLGTGYTDNSVGNVIRKTLVSLGEKIDEELITKEFIYESLNDLRREIDEHKNIIRWPFRTAFDYDAGNVIPGQYRIALPSDLRYPSTNENIISVRIGKSKMSLSYIDKQTWNSYYRETGHTTLNGNVADTDVTITLTSSGDFDESGDIQIAAATVAGTIDEVEYTANNEATNIISGVTGIATGGHSSGVDVWQNASFGLPMYYTVDNGYIMFECPFDDDYAGENIWLDYYKTITDINSDADLLDEPFYHIYIPGLKWKIKAKKDPSLQMSSDSDYLDWNTKKEAQVAKNYTGQDIIINIG